MRQPRKLGVHMTKEAQLEMTAADLLRLPRSAANARLVISYVKQCQQARMDPKRNQGTVSDANGVTDSHGETS